MKTMLVTKRKFVTLLLGAMLCLAGGGVLVYQALAGNAAKPPQAADETRGEKIEAPRQPKTTARVDCYGDPLPTGALARMGTVRQWYGRLGEGIPKTVLAFSPDDRTLVSQNCERLDGSVCLWDTATGREIRWIANDGTGKTRSVWENALLAISLDGKTLAKVGWEANGKEGTVYLWEVATGKLLHKLKRSQEPEREAVFAYITFLPNGKILTLDRATGSDRIYLWDVAMGGREISQLKDRTRIDSIAWSQTVFSPDGKMVAADEWKNEKTDEKKQIISLWEVATGKKIRQLTKPDDGINESRVYSVALSPDGKTLAGSFGSNSGQGNGSIYVWKVATGKLIHRFKANRRKPFVCLAHSPDGKTLLGRELEWGYHLWDMTTGKEIRSFDWKDAPVAVFSHSGKILAVGDDAGVIRLREVATGKEISPLRQGHRDRVTSTTYSPDGKTLASVSNDGTVRLWEVATGKEIRQLAKHAIWGTHPLAYSPDGKMLVSVDDVIHLWDTATGKEIRRSFPRLGDVTNARPQSVTFSPDGKLLAATVGASAKKVFLWQVPTGKQIYTLLKECSDSGDPGGGDLLSVTFSPDGRMLAALEEDGTVSLGEVATGKPIGQLQLKQDVKQDGRNVRFLVFSPDGRILANFSEGEEVGNKVHLWEVATGKEIWQLKGRKGGWEGGGSLAGWSLTFSPDGRMLATIEREKIDLWEVASGKQVGQLSGHRSVIRCVAFSPDGKTLASCGDDLTCLVWDVASFGSRVKPVPASPLSPQTLPKEQLEAAWANLAQDPAKAYAAIRALQIAPAQAIALLQARIRPVAPLANPQQLKRWIADLDNSNFAVRDKAQREIEKLEEVAIPTLRQALKGRPRLEAKRRLQDLLTEWEPKEVGGVSPRRLREFRAVQVLEYIGTAEARQVLQAWTKGVGGARLTVEAEAALARLAKRPVAGL